MTQTFPKGMITMLNDLNMNLEEGPEQEGYDILNLIKISCIKYDIDFNTVINSHIYKYPKKNQMSDEMLNCLYNSCDIGINTCVGEGFGLCNLEHASLGKPQINTLLDIL